MVNTVKRVDPVYIKLATVFWINTIPACIQSGSPVAPVFWVCPRLK